MDLVSSAANKSSGMIFRNASGIRLVIQISLSEICLDVYALDEDKFIIMMLHQELIHERPVEHDTPFLCESQISILCLVDLRPKV